MPERTAAGWRVYGPEQIGRLLRVIALKNFGFPLSRIAELLSGGLFPRRKNELTAAYEAVAARHLLPPTNRC